MRLEGWSRPASTQSLAGGVCAWLRHVLPPVRLLLDPSHEMGGHEQQQCEMVRPAAGQDLQWWVRTPCVVDPDALAQALAVRLRGPVSARVVEACDP